MGAFSGVRRVVSMKLIDDNYHVYMTDDIVNVMVLKVSLTDNIFQKRTSSGGILMYWQAPVYLADDCCLVSDSTRRSLRSADVPTCVVPRTLSSYGDRTFAAAGPRLWNSLPVQLRNPDITYGLFSRQLKEHLFREAGTRRSVTSDMRRLRKTLTYYTGYTAVAAPTIAYRHRL